MASPVTQPRARQLQAAPALLPFGAALLISVAFAGSVIVTPLYPLYQRRFGFSEITLTLIYATYTSLGRSSVAVISSRWSARAGARNWSVTAVSRSSSAGYSLGCP